MRRHTSAACSHSCASDPRAADEPAVGAWNLDDRAATSRCHRDRGHGARAGQQEVAARGRERDDAGPHFVDERDGRAVAVG